MQKKILRLILDILYLLTHGRFNKILPRIYESYNSQMLNLRDKKSLKNIKFINIKIQHGVFLSKSLQNLEINLSLIGFTKQSTNSIDHLNIVHLNDIKNKNIDILYIDSELKPHQKLPIAKYYWVTSLQIISQLNLLKIPYSKIFLINDQYISQGFFISRFFLSVDAISFDFFYKLNHDYNPFEKSTFLSLTLPESYNRHQSFSVVNDKVIKLYSIKSFYGLRHEISWVGCGLSYKFLLSKAKQFNYEQVVICEDDVEFPDDFINNFQTVLQLLNIYDKKWEIFSGLMPQVDTSKIQKVFKFKDKNFISLQFMLGMVFNIYNHNVYDLIANWNYHNLLREQNQIDQYIKQNINLVILPTKFIVKLQNNTPSTIWLDDNIETKYENNITESEKSVQQFVHNTQQVRVIES